MKFQAFLALVAVLGLFCVAAVAQKDYDLDKHPLVLFKEWLDDNPNIRFANVEEEDKRFEIFSANVKKVKELNAKFAPKTRFMINKFAHLTEEEFAQMYLQEMPESMKFKVGDNVLPEVGVERLRDLPEEFDWRTHNPPVVTDVKDQGRCGSCWAFSTTGNIEAIWALAGNPLVPLSEQQLVDCDHVCNQYRVCDSGCNGGLMENALTYTIKNGGLQAETTYPYEARNGACRADNSQIVASITNFTWIPSRRPDQMMYYLVESGPFSVAADATSWQFYRGGVWSTPCGTRLNHGILLVGYGVERSNLFGGNTPYWIIKNSWGKDWGEKGYIRVERGNNRCGLEDYCITATIQKN